MALTFPSDPEDGDIYTSGDSRWRYNADIPAWEFVPSSGGGTGGGASDVSDLETDGLAAGSYLRVAVAGGLEERTAAEVLSDIGAPEADHTHDIGDIDINIETVNTEEYSLLPTDNGKILIAATSVEVPTITIYCSASLGLGFSCMVVQTGSGTVAIEEDTGTTVNAYLDYRTLAGANAAATILAYEADVFNVSGNLVGQPT
jgi:hypothetical protein